jgi:uncharacterized protein
MNIDWSHFTPWASALGGIFIGIAAALFVLLNGRVLGVSSIVGGLLKREPGDLGWRVAFLAGLVLAPTLWRLFAGPMEPRFPVGWAALIVAGLLVGWGTRHGSGCTSGHGVCGISRLSPRSIVATLAFMATGFCTVFIVRHVLA